MCGIAGILRITPASVGPEALRLAMVRPHAEAIPEAWLDVLDESIKHRGPDGQGRFRDRAVRPDGSVVDVAFVHRRLSIIDLAGGAQPMVSMGSGGAARSPNPETGLQAAALPPALLFQGRPNDPVVYRPIAGDDGSPDLTCVVFNGCIYNHRELRQELEAGGARFITDHSDTEVLVRGSCAWGPRLIDRLDGQFAVGVWSRSEARWRLLRDAAGEKPLFSMHEASAYSTNQSTFAFASNAGVLMHLYSKVSGSGGGDLNPSVLRDQLALGFLPGMFTPHWNVEVVGAGEVWSCVDWRAGAMGWEYFAAGLARDRSRPLSADEADRLIEHAVHSRLESDVPLGCFLSGGVDSSLIAAHARRHLGSLRTYSVKMPDPRMDESSWALRVAGHLGTEHHTLMCEAQAGLDLMRLIPEIGLPLGDSSLLPTHWVSSAARGQVKVALAGDGGDELFGGYERYRAARWLDRHADLLGTLPTDLIPQSIGRSRSEKLTRLIEAARGQGYPDLLRVFSREQVQQLTGSSASIEWMWPSDISPNRDPLRFDFERYLPADLMLKVDSAAMSVALEVRAPMLANHVRDAAQSAPLSSLMPRGQRKGLLRQVARRYLPAAIVDRPKQGFAIPIGDWFRTDFGGMKTLLMDHLGSIEPFGPPRLGIDLNMAFIRRLVDEHMDGRRDHGQRLYMLLVLSIWARWLGRVG